MGKVKVPLHHVVTVEHEVEIDDTCPECGHKFAEYERLEYDEGEHELFCDMLQSHLMLTSLKEGVVEDQHLQKGYYEVEYYTRWCCSKCSHTMVESKMIDFIRGSHLEPPASLLSFIKNYDHKKAMDDAAAAKPRPVG
jgi:hypothetical protein